jgi:uncharacterized protein (DUF4415 family)
MKTRFEWDPAKAASNLRKHGVSFSAAVRVFADQKDDVMSKKPVRYDIDLANLPPLTEEQKGELAALAARPDSEIDYSDIPPVTEDFWKNATRGRFYKPTKTSTTVRLDSDVLAWFKGQGKGYQSRINAVLRREMLSSIKS